jgi:phenylpropionate dioxygenase-like ring-hydroxylating dioxygenase large terminal subunit
MELLERTAVDAPEAPEASASPWPRYDAAELGFRNYWYPVTWSRSIGKKPLAVTLLGDPLMFIRERGQVYAFYNQCPHRGIPLSVGRQEFPGTWSCRYHGWTYDLPTGVLKGALTDGPDSPICGKVRVRTYSVAERGGLVWVYMGEGTPPPPEEDIPEDFLHEDAVVVGRITVQRGNWRHAAEGSFDTGHAGFLHRWGSVRTALSRLPAWSRPVEMVQEGPWLNIPRRIGQSIADYPGLGTFPRFRFWNRLDTRLDHGIRMPGVVRLQWHGHEYCDIICHEPVDKDHYRLFQFYIMRARGLTAHGFRLAYELWHKWIHHVQFNAQDIWVVGLKPDQPPSRLYRPDISIMAWRNLCEHARGEPPPAKPLMQEWHEGQRII